MGKFTFKLESVLDQRKHVELQRQRDVATAQTKLLRLQAEFDALSALTRTSAAQLRTTQRLSAAALAAHQRFSAGVAQKTSSLKHHLAQALREMNDAQLALTEAAKQRKVMEKLREREQAKWAETQRRRDLAEADEVARQVSQSGLNTRA